MLQMGEGLIGIGVVNTGHCHPKVVKAVQKQAGAISHAQMNMFYQRPMLELMNQLQRFMPHPTLDTFFFWNSGSEAVEAAIKLARHATGKPNVIVFSGGHHGRTFGTMSLTSSKTIFSGGFGPLMPGVYTVSFPHELHCTARDLPGHTSEHCALDTMQQLELLMKQRTPPQDTAAVLIEPVLGEGGYIPAPPGKQAHLFVFGDLRTKNNLFYSKDSCPCYANSATRITFC